MDEYLQKKDLKQDDLGTDVQGHGSVEDRTNTINYRYREMHVTRSQRGISLTITAQSGGIQVAPVNHRYDITPNPHNDSFYIRHTSRYYAILAQEAMKEVLQKQDWPNRIIVRNENFDEDYTLD